MVEARDAVSARVRADLLDSIRQHRREFETAGERAQELRTLPAETVRTLRGMGVFWLKTPAELGGTPLAPLDFCDVLEELAYADTTTAWTVMVGNGGTGTAGGWLPDAGARRVFAPGRPPPLIVGTPGPRGTGRAVPGGYVVTGRWGFASGVAHCDWLIAGFRDADDAGRMLVGVVPRDQAEVAGHWRVAGLQGTGSFDFRLHEVFVPVEMTFERAAGGTPENVHIAVAVASVYAVETCVDVITGLFRYGGERVLSLSSPMQRYLRDALAARQHIGVSEENYERAGRERIRSFTRTHHTDHTDGGGFGWQTR